jgi:hypothetical protein
LLANSLRPKAPCDYILGERSSPNSRVLPLKLGPGHVFAARWHSVTGFDLRLLFHPLRSSRLASHGASWNACRGALKHSTYRSSSFLSNYFIFETLPTSSTCPHPRLTYRTSGPYQHGVLAVHCLIVPSLDNIGSGAFHVQMHLPTTPLEGRISYSVPKKELSLTRCFTTLDIKRTVHESVCDHSLRRFTHDLARHACKSDVKIPSSIENKTSGNWVALAMPDAIPSRLGPMTCIASLMALHGADNALVPQNAASSTYSGRFTWDLADALPIDLGQQQPSELRIGMKARPKACNSIFDALIKPIMQDLTLIDHSKSIEVIKSWRNHYHESATTLTTSGTAASFDDHLHLCIYTFPSKPWMVTLRYALGLYLEDSELEAIEPAIKAAMQSVVLTRDFWAWPKDSHSTDNNKRLKNAVAISMVEDQCSEAQALVLVKKAAIAAESKFLESKLNVLEAIGKEHSEVAMFLDAVEHFAAGNSLWCSTCPLYHGRR